MKVSEGGSFQNPPPGSHIARCVSLIDLGTQAGQFQGKPIQSRKVRIVWELPEERMDDGRPFTISRRYTLSLNRKAALHADLVAWRGRAFTKEELAGFELKNVLEKTCQLNCVENGEYVNVASIAPLSKKAKAPKQINPTVYFSLEPEEFDREAFQALSEKTQETIKLSPEWKALQDVQTDTPSDDPSHDQIPGAEVDEEQPF